MHGDWLHICGILSLFSSLCRHNRLIKCSCEGDERVRAGHYYWLADLLPDLPSDYSQNSRTARTSTHQTTFCLGSRASLHSPPPPLPHLPLLIQPRAATRRHRVCFLQSLSRLSPLHLFMRIVVPANVLSFARCTTVSVCRLPVALAQMATSRRTCRLSTTNPRSTTRALKK